MNYKLPILTVLVAGSAAAMAQEQPLPTQQDPQVLLRTAVVRLSQYDSLEAQIRQRVAMFDTELIGAGVYQQLARDSVPLLRLELKLQADGETTSLLQVCDGDLLWIRRDMGATQSVTRINLRQVRAELSAGSAAPSAADWMIGGGLPALVASLEANFAFDQVTPGTIDEVPVWILRGRWKPHRLDRIHKSHEPWPPQLPHEVTLLLARDDPWALFPFRIHFALYSPDEPRTRQPGVTIEFHHVRRRPLDARSFSYRPSDFPPVHDGTAEYVESLRRNGAQ